MIDHQRKIHKDATRPVTESAIELATDKLSDARTILSAEGKHGGLRRTQGIVRCGGAHQ